MPAHGDSYMRPFGAMLLFALVGTGAASMTQDEITVRTAYAKLAYAVQINQVYSHTQDARGGSLSELLRTNELRFTLSNVRAGDIKDIASDKYSDLVTEPDGREVIHTGIATKQYTENARTVSMDTVEASWVGGQNISEDWNEPFSKVLPILQAQNDATFSRYVACTVTASYQGKQSTYKALWLFGEERNRKPSTVAIDTIVEINGSSLSYAVSHPIYPAVMIETKLADKPDVRDWLGAHVVDSCAVAKDVCCDPETLQCGLAATTIRQERGNQ